MLYVLVGIHTTYILKSTCRRHSRGWETDSRQLCKPWTLSRVCITVRQFQYELMHIRGKDNAADVLSRLPLGQSQNEETSETEDFAYSVAIEAMRAALVPKQVEVASADHTTLASAPSYYKGWLEPFVGASKGPEEPELPEQVVAPVQCDQPETKASQSSVQPPGGPPDQLPTQFRYISAYAHRAWALVDERFWLQL